MLTAVTDSAQAGRLATTLLGQRLLPAEVIVTASPAAVPAVRDALSKLTDHDIRVVVSEAPRPDGSPPSGQEWVRPLARLATAPWLAPWTADAGPAPAYLLDLACARECAQADAVGFGTAEYEFTSWLDEPALARAALLVPGGPATDDWGGHGLRLFTITAAA